MSDVELLPCPFCGSAPEHLSVPGGMWVRCPECKASSDDSMAAEKWNRRTSLQPAGVRVTVKPLAWEEDQTGWWTAQPAVMIGGAGYEVRVTDSGKVRSRRGREDWAAFDGTLEEAKAAAEADYRQRILSALEVQESQTVSEANEALMRERANMITTHREQIERLTAERDQALQAVDAFSEICIELGVERDNEAGLLAASSLSAKLKLAEAALEPFSHAAGALFTRNYNKGDVVAALPVDQSHPAQLHVTAGDFFNARLALHSIRED